MVLLSIWSYGGWHVANGLPLDSDLLYLLPSEEHDLQAQRAWELMMAELSSRFTVLVGHEQEEVALRTVQQLQEGLQNAGLIVQVDQDWSSSAKQLAKVLFPYRMGLLSESDRHLLLQHQKETLLNRAIGQLYSPTGIVDSRLLSKDPFGLFASFLLQLPNPAKRLTIRNGWLHTHDGAQHWFMLNGRLTQSPYSIRFQEQFMHFWQAFPKEPAALLRFAALFYAQSAASQAMHEASTIGTLGMILTIILILMVFRAIRPLGLTIFAILNGMMCGLVICLLFFDRIHTAALLFGSTLVGVAVDYCLLYFATSFSHHPHPEARIKKVFAGISFGMLTTVLGYTCLAVAPFPGLRQGAAFSVAGLLASWLTVVLWFPRLDNLASRNPPSILLWLRDLIMWLWQTDRHRARVGLALALLLLAVVGGRQLEVNDSIRRYQQLSATLQAEQKQLQQLTGLSEINQFFWISADNDEQLLQLQEQLGDRLRLMRASGILDDWLSIARFVPSAQRQSDNQRLNAQLQESTLPQLQAISGLPFAVQSNQTDLLAADQSGLFAWPIFSGAKKQAVFPIGVQDSQRIGQAANDLPGVMHIDPPSKLSALLARYRYRALWLFAIAATLTGGLLVWRYGWRGGLSTLLPPLLATVSTPLLLALLHIPMGFFTSIALVLVFSIGVDYAIFCAEESLPDIAMLAGIWLAAMTALFSFGLLALSQTPAVQEFGLTLFIGITLSLFLAPWAMHRESAS